MQTGHAIIDLFFNRIEEARGEMPLSKYLKKINWYNENVDRRYRAARYRNILPTIHTITWFDYLFSKDEIVAILRYKLANTQISASQMKLLDDYLVDNEISLENKRCRATLRRYLLFRAWEIESETVNE